MSSLQRERASDSLASIVGNRAGIRNPFARTRPEILVAIVLWLASNAFVAGITSFAKWEGAISYSGVADLCKWDCNWYGFVVESGYDKIPHRARGDRANWPFHPLFPLSVYPIHFWLNVPLAKSLVIGSKIALLMAIYGFLLMVGSPADTTLDRIRAGSLVAFNPYLIYAHAGYAEPLYFAVLAFGFYLLLRERWIAAGATGALVSVTRMVGFIFSISYAVSWLRLVGWRTMGRKSSLNQLVGFLLCPLGTALYMLYLHHHTGDALAQVHSQVAWWKLPGNPLVVLWNGLKGGQWTTIWGLMTVASLAASAWLFKLRRPELGIYLATVVLLSLSGGNSGMARYIWWQPPFLYTIYVLLQRHAEGWPIYLAATSGIATFMVLAWFSGQNFVV